MISQIDMKKEQAKGFTLLELLIVVGIVAILSVALVIVLNPAEALKKARDSTRISDLNTLKTAFGLYLASTSTPSLDSTFGSATTGICTTRGDGGAPTSIRIAYSSVVVPTSAVATAAGADANANFTAATVTYGVATAVSGRTDGTGWIPVNMKAMTGGSPISNFPVDPVNVGTLVASASNLVYRYACQNGSTTAKPSFVFEVNAVLESQTYTVDDPKMTTDGGDNTGMYEVGSSLNLLPVTAAVF